MTELVFIVEEDIDGGYTAKAVGESIFTEAETLEELRRNVREAVQCHFDDPQQRPKLIRLHVTHDEVVTL
ncbi:unnamed protein product [marine sediment metagenome]|uniref:2-oxoisovalerate dehydrogenase n=1 Tax=marine sediment metagenome TaxID=412755 RepID=X0RH93_9ZZZZ